MVVEGGCVVAPAVQLQEAIGPMVQRRWLICVDGSEVSYRCIRLAASLMNAGADRLELLHISDPSLVDLDEKLIPQNILDRCQEEVQAAGVRPFRWKIQHATLRESRSVSATIMHVANRHAAILVLGATGMGTEVLRGASTSSSAMGSVTEACLNRCKVPLLLVRSGPPEAPQHALAPKRRLAAFLGGSNSSQLAYDVALSLSRAGDSLRLLHVCEPSEDPEARAARNRYYQGEVTKQAHLLPKLDCALETLPHEGSVPATISAYLGSGGVDVAVLGAGDLEKLARGVYLGPTCAEVAHFGPTHTLVIKGITSLEQFGGRADRPGVQASG